VTRQPRPPPTSTPRSLSTTITAQTNTVNASQIATQNRSVLYRGKRCRGRSGGDVSSLDSIRSRHAGRTAGTPSGLAFERPEHEVADRDWIRRGPPARTADRSPDR